jgi:DNA-binding CsgD family transcriptional regulator
VAAEKLIGELDEIMEVTGNARVVIHAEGVLAAWRGDESKTRRLVEASVADATARGDERVMALADYATVLVSNGMGDYAKGFTVAQRIAEGDEFIVGSHVLSELIEAAVRTGEQRAALSALERLTERAQLADTHWALGILAYSRALIGADEATDALYREAIDRLGRCRVDVYLGRVHLAYGEWLRRERRRLEAREQLRRAHKLLAGMGANAFAERAVREVCATGEHARRRTADMADDLTPQESRIVALARQGRTNPQIGERLFISPRTVEYHLRNVYAKLNISSRAQLDAALRIGRQSQT